MALELTDDMTDEEVREAIRADIAETLHLGVVLDAALHGGLVRCPRCGRIYQLVTDPDDCPHG